MLLSEKQVMEYVEYVLISVNKQTCVCRCMLHTQLLPVIGLSLGKRVRLEERCQGNSFLLTHF